MKKIIMILLIYLASMYGITFVAENGVVKTPESALNGINTNTYQAYSDTIAYSIWEHKYLTACHEYADSTTYFKTANDSVYGGIGTIRQAVVKLNNIRTYLVSHMALDSCHNGGADVTTVVPSALTYSPNVSLTQIKTYADSLKLAMNAHFAQGIDTKYNYLGKEATADYIAHCAKDTSDSDSVHWKPDITFNTVTFDSTNIDSTYASWNRLKSRFNSHVADTDSVHKAYTNADSITSPNATTYATLYALANEFKTKYNQHVVRDTSSTDSTHFKADTNLITHADLTVGGGHLTADTGTLTGLAHVSYFLNSDYSSINVVATATSVSSGASIYIAGSMDGTNYAVQDSVVVTANGTSNTAITALWKYLKVYCKYYTDGTYKIQFLGGE